MEGAMVLRFLFSLTLILALATAASGARILVHEASDRQLSRLTKGRLAELGHSMESADNEGLASAIGTAPDLVLLPQARRIPSDSLPALVSFLQNQGCLLAIGAPAFSEMVTLVDGQWLTASEASAAAAHKPPRKMLFDFRPGDSDLWEHSTNHPEFDTRITVYDGALSGFVSNLQGWSTYTSPPLEQPFGDGNRLMVFQARGDENTDRLLVEWREKDGSRWQTEVRLYERWTSYALAPEEFRFWQDGSPAGRGGPGDRFNPENARTLMLGLADPAGRMGKGWHTWWIRKVGVSPDPTGGARVELPRLDTLCPAYKTYPMVDVERLGARSDQAVFDRGFSVSGAVSGHLPIWRTRGLGSFPAMEPPGMRFIPLVDAYDHHGDWRGTAAWLLLHFAGAYKDGIWGGIGVDPDSLTAEQEEDVAGLAATMAHTMLSGAFFRNAGASRFLMGRDEEIELGASAVNPHGADAAVSVRFRFAQEGKDREIGQHDAASLPTGSAFDWEAHKAALRATPGPARVIAELIRDGEVVDVLHQPVSISASGEDAEFIQAVDGQFHIGKTPWYGNGVNYWPRSSLGKEPGQQHLDWLRPWQYDPEVVERDLRTLWELNINLVSIQYMHPEMAPQLRDFLERCRLHRIHVNIFIDGANPLNPDLDKVRGLIEAAGLRENPQVFAYDLAWEPRIGNEGQRAAYDQKWREWIDEQYGSLERAESTWGHSCPRDESGRASGPRDEHLTHDGPWRVMVAAYRRFADDMISRGYGQVVRFIHSLDPNHLMGARTGYGGTGQAWVVPHMPFDLASGAAHLDFISPEGYGLSGDYETVLAGGFVTEYARMVSGGKPVFWAEFGFSVWPDPEGEETLQKQAGDYEQIYRMLTFSNTNASAAWWFPGGYRVEENSDYGIVRQDDKPRPAGLVIRDQAARMQKSLALQAADGHISVDRDRHTDGLAGMWATARTEYLASALHGRRKALTTDGTGTTSATAPALAVGGGPWEPDMPSKYLNAEFASVQMFSADGTWEEASKGAIRVSAGGPIRIRASVVNTGEAAWLKDVGGTGTVQLNARVGTESLSIPLPANTPALSEVRLDELRMDSAASVPTQVELRMTCSGHHDFGQRMVVEVLPAAPGSSDDRTLQ